MTTEQKASETLAHQVARMLVTRSGWYSSTLHLALIAMVIITGIFLTLTEEHRAANFIGFGGLLLGAAAIYSGKRFGESVVSQRAQSAQPPAPPPAQEGEPS